MKQFSKYTSILELPESKKHIRNYNRLAGALIEFEILWYRSWYSVVDQAKTGLQATLLVSDSRSNIYINFDPQITQLIKEAKTMKRLNLEVPESIKNICLKEIYYKDLYVKLQEVLERKSKIIQKIPEILRKAMVQHLDQLDKTLHPGLTALTW